jgi:hypothetical protein
MGKFKTFTRVSKHDSTRIFYCLTLPCFLHLQPQAIFSIGLDEFVFNGEVTLIQVPKDQGKEQSRLCDSGNKMVVAGEASRTLLISSNDEVGCHWHGISMRSTQLFRTYYPLWRMQRYIRWRNNYVLED